MESRYASTQLLMPLIKDIITEGSTVKLTVTGNSMLPLLRHELDQVELGAFSGDLEKGDIVLIRRDDGDYVLHRVYRLDEAARCFYMLGDAQRFEEGPLAYEQIVAVAVALYRGERRIGVDKAWYHLFVGGWFKLLRLRPRILWACRKLRLIP